MSTIHLFYSILDTVAPWATLPMTVLHHFLGRGSMERYSYLFLYHARLWETKGHEYNVWGSRSIIRLRQSDRGCPARRRDHVGEGKLMAWRALRVRTT